MQQGRPVRPERSKQFFLIHCMKQNQASICFLSWTIIVLNHFLCSASSETNVSSCICEHCSLSLGIFWARLLTALSHLQFWLRQATPPVWMVLWDGAPRVAFWSLKSIQLFSQPACQVTSTGPQLGSKAKAGSMGKRKGAGFQQMLSSPTLNFRNRWGWIKTNNDSLLDQSLIKLQNVLLGLLVYFFCRVQF